MVYASTLRAGRKRCQVGALALLAVACGRDPAAQATQEAPGSRADAVRLRGVSLARWERDALRTAARADEARIDRTERRVELNALGLSAFDADGRAVGTLVARTATTDLGGETWSLRGGVVARDPTGRTIETEHARIHTGPRVVEVPGPARLSGANFRADAPSLRVELDPRTIQAPGPVTATITSDRPPR